MSIRVGWSNFRFLIIVAIGFTCTAVLSIALTIWWLHSTTIADASRNTNNLAVVLAEQIANSIQSIDLVLTEIQGQVEIRQARASNDVDPVLRDEGTYKLLTERLSRLQQADFIGLLDNNGRIVNTTRKWPSPGNDVSYRDYFQHFKSNNDKSIYIGKSDVDRLSGSHVIFFSKRINGANNTFLGVVTIGVRLTYLQQIYKSIISLGDQAVLLLHRDGTVIVRFPDQIDRAGEKIPAVSPWYRLVLQGGGTYRAPGMFDGEARVTAVRPLRNYPLVVSVGIKETAALATWRNQAIILGIGVLLVIAVSVFLLKSLSKQFHRVVISEATVTEKAHELERANAKVDIALNNMTQGLVMFDSAARIIICNDRYRQIYKLPSELAKPGCTVLDLLKYRTANRTFFGNPEQYISDLLAMIAHGKTTSQAVELGDGRIISMINIPTADGGWVATHEDVTNKVQAENEIKNQKQQLNATLENVSQGVCMFDAAQRLIFCNKHYADLYELDSEQTKPGTSFRQLLQSRIANGNVPVDHENYIKDRLSEVSITQPYQIINQLRDGRQVLVVHRPVADGGWVATHEDVTEVNRREESFRMLFTANPVPMWVANRASLRFLAVNEAAIKHYGYSREQFLAMTVFDLLASKDRERFAKYYQSRPDDQLVENITQHLKADGTTIDVCVYSRTLTYDGNSARMAAIHDITERKRAEDELRRTKKFLDTVIENIPVPIMVKETPSSESDARNSHITLINRACEELLGVPRQQIIGKTNSELYPKEHAEFIVAHDNETLQSDQPVLIHDHLFVTPGNGTRLITLKKVAIHNDDGKPHLLLSVCEDVTEQRRTDERFAYAAHHDALTGLPNRKLYYEQLEQALKRVRRGERLAVLYLDLDHLKRVNDTLGHAVGDELLKGTADRLRGCVRDTDLVARLGGDEFAIIQTMLDQPSDAAALAMRIREAILEPFDLDGHQVVVDISVGISIAPSDASELSELLKTADIALYEAKNAGRGTYCFYAPEMNERIQTRSKLEQDLQSALVSGEFELFYQPIVSLQDNKVSSFEALLRWHHPTRGLVSPAEFIPVAEDTGLIIPLGEWVLREACAEAATWPDDIRVAVNVSSIQLTNKNLTNAVVGAIASAGIQPNRLELEITESVFIQNTLANIATLKSLHDLGVRFTMDDFGTGYSSLSYLLSFPFHKIKIDRCFIAALSDKNESHAIVRAVADLARSLKLWVTAEGVETEQQLQQVRLLGCTEMQGYLLSPPRPAAEILQFFTTCADSIDNLIAVNASAGRKNGKMCGIRPNLVCSERLTGRECDVLMGIMAGDSCKQSARHLNISPRTVELHRGRIKRKFDIKNSADLVRVMLTKGCTPSQPKSALRHSQSSEIKVAVTPLVGSIKEPESDRGAHRRARAIK